MGEPLYHVPVMTGEVGQYLIHHRPGIYIDGTLGGGGHSEYLLSQYPDISIIGLDWDEEAIIEAGKRLARYGERTRLYRENYKDAGSLLTRLAAGPVDGILLDLGVSSRQFDRPDRGFSFQSPNLDMRMDQRQERQAMDMVNTLPESELADLIYQLGEERRSRPISRAIVRARAAKCITSGQELAAIVEKAHHREGKAHPATRVFQALRIAVNRELENISEALAAMPHLLKPGGRAVVISYHSLEDRLIKQAFKKMHADRQCIMLTKKVVRPSEEEMKNNPRSRSAKLRALEKIA